MSATIKRFLEPFQIFNLAQSSELKRDHHKQKWASLRKIAITFAIVAVMASFGAFIERTSVDAPPKAEPSSMEVGTFSNFLNNITYTFTVKAIMEWIAFILTTFLGIYVFIWSWLAFAHTNESREALYSSWTGRQVYFDSIGHQIQEFKEEMQSGALSQIRSINLMLSTLIYGIEDKEDGPKAIKTLFDVLGEWVKTAGSDDQQRNLTFGLWDQCEHQAIWSVKYYEKGSDWYRGSGGDNRRSVDDIRKYLDAMKHVCDFFHKLQDSSSSVILNVNQVHKSDFRFFIIRRDRSLPYGMVVIFSPFVPKTVHDNRYRSTGFITHSSSGVDQMERMIDGTHSSVVGGEPIQSRELLSHLFLDNPERYMEKFFGLDQDYLGLSKPWHEDTRITAEKIYALGGNPPV